MRINPTLVSIRGAGAAADTTAPLPDGTDSTDSSPECAEPCEAINGTGTCKAGECSVERLATFTGSPVIQVGLPEIEEGKGLVGVISDNTTASFDCIRVGTSTALECNPFTPPPGG